MQRLVFLTMNGFMNDVRYALRGLSRSRGFTAVAVLMLALGIGVNAAVFTVTKAVLFKGSRSIDRNDRILYIGSGGPCCVSYPDFEDWRAQAKSFVGMGAVADLRITLSDRSRTCGSQQRHAGHGRYLQADWPETGCRT